MNACMPAVKLTIRKEVRVYINIHTIFRVEIEYSVTCDENYYGNECTILCKPDQKHYTCTKMGQRSCLRGE
jgi:hypothetical protein